MFKWFHNISIIKKIYVIAGVLALMIACQILGIWLSLNTLSSVRSLVLAESRWSKAQKNAVYYLIQYARSGNESDYQKYLLSIARTTHSKRVVNEIIEKTFNAKILQEALLDAGNHPDDVPGIVKFIKRFNNDYYFKKSIGLAAEASSLISEIQQIAGALHSDISTSKVSFYSMEIERILNRIDGINSNLTRLEDDFSATLREGTRRMEAWVLSILLFSSLLIVFIGLSMGLLIGRLINRGISAILHVAPKIAAGDLSQRAIVFSKDEIGSLATAFNKMTDDLERNVKTIKAREEEIQAIFKNAPDAIILINRQGTIVRWNPRAEAIFGWKEAEVKGKSVYEVIIPEQRREAERARLKGITEGKELPDPNKPEEFIVIRNDGTEFDAEATISSTVLDGEYFLVTSMKDITDRKSTEEMLRQKSEDLIRSNKELEQFVYVASHDLQEPIRMITSFLQLLEKNLDGKLDMEAKEFIGFAVDGSNRMKLMIEDLLSFSRLLSSKLKIEKANVGSIINDVKSMLRKEIGESGATIVSGKMPVISADKEKLSLLFRNLMSNAVRFRKKGNSPVVEISWEEDPEYYRFAVKDNGIGMKREHQNRLFKIFQRIHSKQEYPGNGIGLAECKKIAEMHGGTIWVESEIDKGSTFYVTIKKKLLTKNRIQDRESRAETPPAQYISTEVEKIRQFSPNRTKVLSSILSLVLMSVLSTAHPMVGSAHPGMKKTGAHYLTNAQETVLAYRNVIGEGGSKVLSANIPRYISAKI